MGLLPIIRKDPKVVEHQEAYDEIDVKFIKILNAVSDLHSKIDESTLKVITEVKSVDNDILSLSELLKTVPKETIREVSNIKKNSPDMYQELQSTIAEHVRKSVLDVIDARILKLINDSKSVTSLALLKKATEGNICSKNTLFRHLERLDKKGLIAKKRSNHKIFYSVTDAVMARIKEVNEAAEEVSGKGK